MPTPSEFYDSFSRVSDSSLSSQYLYGLNLDGSIDIADINDCDLVCDADLNNDGAADFFDVSLFLSLYAAQDSVVDYNSDGTFDFFDVSAFLDLYAIGCP